MDSMSEGIGPSVVRPADSPAVNHACSACSSTRVKVLRHSDRWNFDVGRCRDCGTARALDARSPEEVEGRYDKATQDAYVELMSDSDRVYAAVLAGLRERLTPQQDPMVFDVGAGTGEFLATARDAGFRISGSELNVKAAEYTLERHGIELSTRRLAEERPESADALTMWCVVAHVPKPEPFLEEALAVLRPGGVLFLRTPRWCSFDTLGTLAGRASRGRVNVTDVRVTQAHLHLFSDDGLRKILSSAGFADIDVVPTCHWGFSPKAYAGQVRSPALAPAARAAASALDRLIERGWFIRNTAFVWARRPS